MKGYPLFSLLCLSVSVNKLQSTSFNLSFGLSGRQK